MEFLDDFDLKPEYLSEEFSLFRPDLNYSVAGVLPELVNRMDLDFTLPDVQPFASHPMFAKDLDEYFPSGFDSIVFLICDALGVEHISKLGGPLWENLQEQGTIASSSFPTMTATVMTSLSYGMHPSHHGMVGYNIYNEHLDQIWNGLNLMTLDDDGKEKMVLDMVDYDKLVNHTPIIELVNQQHEIEVTFLTPKELVSPGLDDLLNPQLEREDYNTPEDGVMRVIRQLNNDRKNQVIALYIPYADHFGHYHGPESKEYEMAIRGIENAIASIGQHPSVQNGSTAIALTSDHGQSQINHDISKWMTRDQWKAHKDNGITLSTSGRTLHTYCDPSDLDKANVLLEELADGRGLVISQETAIDLAGGNHSDQIKQRMGQALMIMEDTYLHDVPEIVQYGSDVRLHGQHGSLTSKELYVPVGLFGGQI